MRKNTVKPIDASFEQGVSNMVGGSIPKPIAQQIKSPLRYPGGKSRAVKTIIDMLPQGLDRLCSPFFGGGSIELAVASKYGTRVYGYDAFLPLVAFWKTLLQDPKKLFKKVSSHHPLSRTKFYALQRQFVNMQDKIEIAAAFFVLNRSSFSGTTLSGGMSPDHPRFTLSAIKRLADFNVSGLSVACIDFKKSITKHKNVFLYLDPPYANGGALYGNKGNYHKNFDHKSLAKILRDRGNWLLSYNDCKEVREMYQGFTFVEPEWTYGMSNDKKSKEVLIISGDYIRAT